MIRFAKDEDHPQLKALWNQVFGDSEAAIDFYFSNRECTGGAPDSVHKCSGNSCNGNHFEAFTRDEKEDISFIFRAQTIQHSRVKGEKIYAANSRWKGIK